MTELKSVDEVYLLSGRTMKAEVDGNLVSIKIGSAHEGMAPFDVEKEPSVFIAALKKFGAANPGFEPKCLILQLKDMVVYLYKRVL